MNPLTNYAEVFNKNDSKLFAELFADDCIFYDTAPTCAGMDPMFVRGKEGVDMIFNMYFHSMPMSAKPVSLNGNVLDYIICYPGIEIPCRGELLLEGENLLTQPFSRRAEQVVYLPQTLPAGVHLHVLESIIVAQRAAGGRHSPQRQEEVMALLRQLGIAHLAMSYLDQLSGGQKQLVGLAQSLIRQPRLLLLDEPLSALDLNYQFHVMDLVRRETRRRNIVTLVVVHDINIALRHADHVLMLKAGQLLGDGTPAAVITPETLAAVYGVRGRIEPCSQGVRQVIIDGLVDSEA